ncbi:MAG: PIN domain nuclease of toxin-antitoxin system [Bacteroidia bacterium]|jgi:PIN domain nuclease of toxin-antitoxin system
MRALGMILSLAAILWVMYQATGGGEVETVITPAQQASLERAKNVEESMQAALQQRMGEAEKEKEIEIEIEIEAY